MGSESYVGVRLARLPRVSHSLHFQQPENDCNPFHPLHFHLAKNSAQQTRYICTLAPSIVPTTSIQTLKSIVNGVPVQISVTICHANDSR